MTKEEKRVYMKAYMLKYRYTAKGKAVMKKVMDNANLQHIYGFKMDEFNARLAAQGNVCAICGRSPSCQVRRFSVDHNHACCPGQKSCGKCIRGILCGWCNRIVVPLFETYSQIIEPAQAYLRKYA